MEVQQVVVLTEAGHLQLTSLSRHVLYHTILALLPDQSMFTLLPKSGSRKIENFCNELPQAIIVKSSWKKQSELLFSNPFIPSIDIHKFLERAITVEDFTLLLEKNLLEASQGELDPDRLHEICWNFYEIEMKSAISIRQWFSSTCTYRLWLIFCCVQEPVLVNTLSAKTVNEVIKRLVELCGYTWNKSYRYSESDLDFPQYIHAIASYFSRLNLEMSLTCEVIVDMVDEIVHGVLKKGYLTKKGHKRRNWNKRWFVLQRTIMKYFVSRENMELKGQLVLNGNTKVKGLPDTGKRKCCFEVTCGHTEKSFEICADDQRTKHEWMLAIKKAIALANVLDGSSKQDDYSEQLTGFYLLKYGTPYPGLHRQDSTVSKMKYHATMKEHRLRLSRGRQEDTDGHSGIPTEYRDSTHLEEYVEMNPLHSSGLDSSCSSNEGEGYITMSPVNEIKSEGLAKSLDNLDLMPGSDTGMESVHRRSYSDSKENILSVRTSDEFYTQVTADRLDEEDSSANVYRLLADDPELGGYIDVGPVSTIGTPTRGITSISHSLPTTMNDYLSPTGDDMAVSRSEVEDSDEMSSKHHPSYLTIILGSEGSSKPTLLPKKSPSHAPLIEDDSEQAPAPPPRSKSHVSRESSLPTFPTMPMRHKKQQPFTQTTVEETIPSKTNSNHRNTMVTTTYAPPLPPRQ